MFYLEKTLKNKHLFEFLLFFSSHIISSHIRMEQIRMEQQTIEAKYNTAEESQDYDALLRWFRSLQPLWIRELQLINNRAQLYGSVDVIQPSQQQVQRRSVRLRRQRCKKAISSFMLGTYKRRAFSPRCDHCGLCHQ
jgi:hypothetical protein